MRNWLATIPVSSTARAGAEIAENAETPIRTPARPISAIPAISAVGLRAGKGVQLFDDGAVPDPKRVPHAPTDDDWSAEDWQVFFDERAGIAEFDGGLSRPGAEAQAQACCMEQQIIRNQRTRGAP